VLIYGLIPHWLVVFHYANPLFLTGIELLIYGLIPHWLVVFHYANPLFLTGIELLIYANFFRNTTRV